jgi:hypothetical protein
MKRIFTWSVPGLVGLLLGLALISGCATGKNKAGTTGVVLRYASENRMPAWITDIPEDKNYYYFVGTSGDADNFDKGKKESINDSLSQVVSTIGITVSASSTYEEKYFAEQYSTTISSELLTEGKAKLQDTEVTQIYYEQYEKADGTTFYRVWVLLKYSKSEIAREQKRLEEVLLLKYGEVKKLELNAVGFTEKGLLADAVIAHLNAGLGALKILDGDVMFDRNMNRATEIMLKLKMKKAGEDQLGWVGTPLENPLVLTVYFLEGENEMPVPNIPVKFSYRVPKEKTAGYKYQVYYGSTGSNGKVDFNVDMVHEVSDANEVIASVDFNPYLKQLKSVPPELKDRVQAFKTVQQKKKVTFVFQSDTIARSIKTAVYFFQVDEDDQLLTKPITAPGVYRVLYKKKFSVKELDIPPSSIYGKKKDEIMDKLLRSAGKNTVRLIFGTVQILGYDEISGFYTATASATAALYEIESGDVIRTWQIQRSGTGNSKKAAQLKVLEEVGNSLGEVISNKMP